MGGGEEKKVGKPCRVSDCYAHTPARVRKCLAQSRYLLDFLIHASHSTVVDLTLAHVLQAAR